MVLVTRHRPYRQEVYAFRMSAPIPCVPIPLSGADPDVPLDLQSAFARCWEGGPYPELLRYEGDPPVRCSAEELAWSLRQFQPQLMMILTRGRATQSLEAKDYAVAIAQIEEGIENIRELYQEHARGEMSDSEMTPARLP